MDRHQRARRLKLRQLEIIVAVAETGSMVKAAAVLAVTQPAISRAIADAERELGVSLFDRSAQGVAPTEYGRALLRRGIAAFDEIDQGVKDIEFLADPSAGELRIGSGAGLAEGIVLAVINRLSRQYPRVVYDIVITEGLALCEQLRSRTIEVGMGIQSPESERLDDILVELLYEESMLVVACADSPWARRRKIELAELVNERWTWPSPRSRFGMLVVEAFRASGLKPPRAAVHTHALNVRISLAATGPFLAVVPAGVMSSPGKYPSVRVLPVEFPAALRQVAAFTLKNRALSPLAQRFIDCAREVARPTDERSKHPKATRRHAKSI
jgi:DNA-binding transcriptional LysR family regulator